MLQTPEILLVLSKLRSGGRVDQMSDGGESRLKLDTVSGRPRLTGQPSSRTGENSPYGSASSKNWCIQEPGLQHKLRGVSEIGLRQRRGRRWHVAIQTIQVDTEATSK
jgi:hypothetical protein